LADRYSRRAIAAFERFWVTSANTSISRIVSPAALARVERLAPRLRPRTPSALSCLRSRAAIARRLYLSAKTVDHHASAILSKLGIASRREAAAAARRLGIEVR